MDESTQLQSVDSSIFRGQNIVSGFAFREIVGKSDSCIVEWVLCLDLKGYIPRYVLDAVSAVQHLLVSCLLDNCFDGDFQALTSSMTDYISNLRKHVNELRQKGRGRAPRTH